jgi:hypothetical protein
MDLELLQQRWFEHTSADKHAATLSEKNRGVQPKRCGSCSASEERAGVRCSSHHLAVGQQLKSIRVKFTTAVPATRLN